MHPLEIIPGDVVRVAGPDGVWVPGSFGGRPRVFHPGDELTVIRVDDAGTRYAAVVGEVLGPVPPGVAKATRWAVPLKCVELARRKAG